MVHEHHGVGRYVGMVKMPADGIEKDYVKIAYAGSDVLYVPATQLDLISKYIGGGEDAQETRKLSKLGGTDWERAKKKATIRISIPHPALRPAAAAARLRLLPRLPLAAGV